MKSLSSKNYEIESRSSYAYRHGDVGGNKYKVLLYGESIYLTQEEHDYFLQKLSDGKKIIKIGNITLTNKFQAIIPLED